MNEKHVAEFEAAGYQLLGLIVKDLIDGDRLDQYDEDRIAEAVLMAPEFFWDRFVCPALDKMANELRYGFEAVDAEVL